MWKKQFGFILQFKRCHSTNNGNNFKYCMDIVRKCDYESYLSTLLLQNPLRRDSFILRAFQIEVSQIRDIVSDNKIGLMRLQFWRNSINTIFEKEVVPQSPIALGLSQIVNNHKISKPWFNRILDAREEQLESDRPFSSIEHIEKHSENIHSSLYYLILQCAGINSLKADHTASHLGKAQGLVTLLRGLPYNASKRIVYLPMDLMIKHKLSQEDVIRKRNDKMLKEVCFEIASQANSHIEKALSHWHEIPDESKTIFLAATPVKMYLKSIQKADFDPFESQLLRRNNWLPMVLFMNKFRKSI